MLYIISCLLLGNHYFDNVIIGFVSFFLLLCIFINIFVVVKLAFQFFPMFITAIAYISIQLMLEVWASMAQSDYENILASTIVSN